MSSSSLSVPIVHSEGGEAPGPNRRAVAIEMVAFLLTLGLFVSLSFLVASGRTDSFDVAGVQWMRAHATPTLDALAPLATRLGSETVGVMTPVLAIILVVLRRWRWAVVLVVASVGTSMLNDLLKEGFQRARPIADYLAPRSAQTYAYPSGHAMHSATFYGLLFVLAGRWLRGRRPVLLRTLGVIAVCLVVLVSLTRVYLSLHYPADVVGGVLAGVLWLAVVLAGCRLAAWLEARVRYRWASRHATPSLPT